MKRIVFLIGLVLMTSMAYGQTVSFTNYSEKSMDIYYHTSGLKLAYNGFSIHVQEKFNLENYEAETTNITGDYSWNSSDFNTFVYSSVMYSASENMWGKSSYLSPFISLNQSLPVGKLSVSVTSTYNFDADGNYTGSENDYYGVTINYGYSW